MIVILTESMGQKRLHIRADRVESVSFSSPRETEVVTFSGKVHLVSESQARVIELIGTALHYGTPSRGVSVEAF